jgi:hypothetical protein
MAMTSDVSLFLTMLDSTSLFHQSFELDLEPRLPIEEALAA